MAAVPAGYEAFQSKRRRGVTLLSFLLVSTIVMGMSVYVDSYSVHYWDESVDVGDVSLIIESWELDLANALPRIRQIDGVTKAILLEGSAGVIYTYNEWGYQGDWMQTKALSEEYLEEFPNIYNIVQGRLPQNESEIAIADYLLQYEWINITYGSTVNFSITDDEYDAEEVRVVGVFTIGDSGGSDWFSDYYFYADLIVVESLIGQLDQRDAIHADIDRSRIGPFDANGALFFLSGINQQILELDPSYGTFQYSRYSTSNLLENGVRSYIVWQTTTRMSQLMRAGAIIVLVIMVSFLAIRFNVNERRYEANMLMARGASEGDVNGIINREIGLIALASCLLGPIFGLLGSRIAIASTGFFQFDFTLMITEPFLISLESLLMALVIGFLLPLFTLVGYRAIYSTKKTVEESTGRLAKVSRGLTLIRWDALIVVLTSLLMLALYAGGPEIQSNFLLGFIASITPLPLFLGVASLVIKGLRRGSVMLSKRFVRIVGEVSSSVGVRRIGKEASSAGPAVMVLVLAISLAWNNALVDSTLPATHLNHSRFAMGADVAFQLDPLQESQWDGFLQNISSHAATEAVTQIDVTTLYLADDWYSRAYFAAIDPQEYSQIGYDQSGVRLNESSLSPLLMELEDNPTGIILTQDIADTYSFDVGDILRAFEQGEVPQVFEFTIIGIAPAIPEVLVKYSNYRSGGGVYYMEYGYSAAQIVPPPPYYYYYESYGTRRAWIHRAFAETLLNETSETQHFCVASARRNANGTAMAADVLDSGGSGVIMFEQWGTVDFEVAYYLGQVVYQMDRAVDTMLTTFTVGVILGAFGIYAVEGITSRKREIALLRSIGARNSLVVGAQGAELLVLTLVSLFLLLGYGPLFIANSLISSLGSYSTWSFLFPVAVFPVIPWFTLVIVLMFFIVSTILFIAAIALLGSRVNIAAALNAAWAEAGPYGGDL
ncbi:MAG: FtsX-like permease family protein [Candidatus Thorarchaeota archaeon]